MRNGLISVDLSAKSQNLLLRKSSGIGKSSLVYVLIVERRMKDMENCQDLPCDRYLCLETCGLFARFVFLALDRSPVRINKNH